MLRLWRLIAAAVRDGGEDTGRIIDEMEDCVCCLRIMVNSLTACSASLLVAVTKDDKAVAVAVVEKQIGKLVEAARQQL
jgi:hypothetical protein